jgi:aerobic-type carbon monoxide dehydrogenase small subunit (CoxS/CutS family)
MLMPASISFTLNGKQTSAQTEADRSLLEVLREDLKFTGTKYGCGEGACGACSVLVDGKRRFSCSTAVSEVAGASITTIEGLADGDKLHPVQRAFLEEASFQCGYCTPGMIMNCVALLKRNAHPDEAEICKAMDGNICRCGTYPRIVNAVQRASQIAQEVSNAK